MYFRRQKCPQTRKRYPMCFPWTMQLVHDGTGVARFDVLRTGRLRYGSRSTLNSCARWAAKRKSVVVCHSLRQHGGASRSVGLSRRSRQRKLDHALQLELCPLFLADPNCARIGRFNGCPTSSLSCHGYESFGSSRKTLLERAGERGKRPGWLS